MKFYLTYYKICIILILRLCEIILKLIIMIMKIINFKHNKNQICRHFVLLCYKNIETSKKKEVGNE